MNSHTRRGFLRHLACGCAAASLPFAASEAFAASAIPKTSLTADQALALLKEGNAAFMHGSCAATGASARVAALSQGQAPYAIIIGCADSRTSPEQLFSRGLGELFTIRVAGNTVDTVGLGSIEYGVAVLGAPLVVVLGHTQCGAVDAAVKMVRDKARFPGVIGKLATPIIPAVQSIKGNDDVLNRSVRANVDRVVAQLRIAKPIVSKAVKDGAVKVVGGVYNLESGAVNFAV